MSRPRGALWGEGAAFLLALALFWIGLSLSARAEGWEQVRLSRYPTFIPLGLLALSLANHWLRSRVLGWGLFTFSFVCLMAVLGAWAVGFRGHTGVPGAAFLRAMAMYGCLGMAALFQLRAERPAA